MANNEDQLQAGAVVVDEEGNIVDNPQSTAVSDMDAGGEDGMPSGDDARLTNDDQQTDDELQSAETEAEREEIRKRRREERHLRKQRQREREEKYQRDIAARDAVIDEMRQRLDIVERRGQGADMAQLDSAIKQSADAYQYFKGQIAEATAAQNGQLVAEATEKMMLAGQRAAELARIKQAYQGRQAAPRPAPMDPRVTSKAQAWAESNSWYDVDGKDMDSRVVRSLDADIMADGYDPRTEAYWEELDSRIKKYLPHRAKMAHNSSQGRESGTNRSPVAPSGKQGAAGNGSGATFVLSPERVQAIKDAGKWEDPAERAQMIKRYRDYDRQQAAA